MYKPAKRTLLGTGLLFLPMLLTGVPISGRLACVFLLAASGLFFWSRRQPMGALLLSAAVLSGWVALASFPLVISKWDSGLLYALLSMALFLPWAFFGCLRGAWSPGLVLWLTVALLLMLNARPGRRFASGQENPALVRIASRFSSVEETTAYVHHTIKRRKGPPTDTALDTLRRGYGHCGAMNNLLHKLLLAQGYHARIIHLDGNNLHTLVEIDGDWIADAQENVVLFFHPLTLVGTKDASLPRSWKNHHRLWVYHEHNGYQRLP